MPTYIVLLRGINVGGSNKLPMHELVTALEAGGFEEVRTYIQSGNAVVRTAHEIPDDAAEQISRSIEKSRGFAPHVLVLSARDLERAISGNPYPTEAGKALHFYFLDGVLAAKAAVDRLEELKAASESFTLHGRVLYLHASDGIARSKLAASVERLLGVPATARNWNTVARLAEMAGVPISGHSSTNPE